MNYLWLIVVLIGLYFVGTTIYSLTKSHSTMGYITTSLQLVIALGFTYWAYGNMTYVEPSLVPSSFNVTGGRRRRHH